MTEPLSAEAAAVAAAEAIAAEAAADIAAEAVSTAEAMVLAATSAAAKAAVRAKHTAKVAADVAAQAAVDIAYEAAATAEATVVAATSAAAKAADVASHRTAEASAAETAADIAAQAAATATAMVLAAKAAAARAMVQAKRTAQAAADVAAQAAADIAAEAAATAEAMVVAATEAAAETMAVAATAAAAEAAVRSQRDQLTTTAVGADVGRNGSGSALDDGPVTTRPDHWVSCDADPLLPLFASALDTGTEAKPAESALWRDISLVGRVRAALQATEAHFEMVFDSAPTALVVASVVEGRPAEFVRVNRACSRLTGWPAVRLLGAAFADLTHPYAPVTQEPDVAVPQGPAEVTRVQRWVHGDGGEMWVRLRMAALPSSGSSTEQQLVCHVERLAGDVPVDAHATRLLGDDMEVERLLARADERDRSAEVRDRSAEARDRSAEVRDRTAGDTALEGRSGAAGLDRNGAAIDRLHGGQDRDWSAVDREALIASLRARH